MKVLRKTFKVTITLLSWSFLLLFAFFAWLLVSTSGSQFLINKTFPLFGASAEHIEGSIASGLTIGRFALDDEGIRIQAENATIDVLWHRLFSLQANISVFRADLLTLQWYPTHQDDPPDDSAIELPQLPFNARIDALTIKRLQIEGFASKNAIAMHRPPLFSIVSAVHHVNAQLNREGDRLVLEGDIDIQYLSEGVNINAHLNALLKAKSLYALPQATIKATIQEGSVVHEAPLSGVAFIEMRPQQGESIQVDSTIQWAKNTLRLQGGLGHADSELTLQAHLPELDKISASAGKSADIKGVIKGGITAHTVALNGVYTQGSNHTLGDAPVDFSLAVKGELGDLSWPVVWQAEMTEVLVKHLSYQLNMQQATPFSLRMGKLLKWDVGESTLILSAPDNTETQIRHIASSGEGDTLSSEGVINNLSLENHHYDAKWQIAYNDTMQATVDLARRGDAPLAIQKNPIFNFKSLHLSLLPANDRHRLTVVGEGEKTALDGYLNLDFQSPYFLEKGELALALSDGSSAHVYGAIAKDEGGQHFSIDINTQKLALDTLSFHLIPKGLVSSDIKTRVSLSEKGQLLAMALYGNIAKGSVWNKQPIDGVVDVVMRGIDDEKESFNPLLYWVDKADINLTQGKNKIKIQGAFGRDDDVLHVDIQALHLSDVYPSLQGGVFAQGYFAGAVDAHRVDMRVNYVADGTLNAKRHDMAKIHLKGDGAWVAFRKNVEGWWGSVWRLSGNYQGFGLEAAERVDISFIPSNEEGQIEWSVGKAHFNVLLPGQHKVLVQNSLATGKNAAWESKGTIDGFVINSALVKDINALLTQDGSNISAKGGVFVRNKNNKKISHLVFDAEWDIAFDKRLEGQLFVKRTAGDFMVPAPTPFALGLQQLDAHGVFSPVDNTHSLLRGEVNFHTQSKGSARAQLTSLFNGLVPDLNGGTSLSTKGEIKDIAWASAFTNDVLGLEGEVAFDMGLQSQKNGQWNSSGYIHGNNLRILETENGIRLMNGTLKASLDNNKVRLETLYFPAVIRVMPTEKRTKEWLDNTLSAQKGSLHAQGDWDINTAKGNVNLVFEHYPIMQRADRFAMVSGDVNIDAKLPSVDLSGKVVADAGWASIDIQGNVPTVDSDVIILSKNNDPPPPSSPPIDLNMDIEVDLGQHFYLAGMGLNSGLEGGIHLLQKFGRLAAEGQFRTKGGRLDIYGQRLQIAKGDMTFTGDVANPALNIEAIRRGAEVEAGVRVLGTVKKPNIKLVSYPDVSEVEKLSWLIMGRGPDSSGADLGMLLSVGGALIGGEEPMYKKLGIDDIGIKAGTVGASDKLLAKRTVGDSASYRYDDEVGQIAYATKKLAENWSVSVEQAMSRTGTIIQGSYQLMKYITIDLKAGTVNGLEFIYKRVFND